MPEISFNSPHGAAWTLTALMVVVWLGPRVAEFARLPGIIGLLAGGWLIGSHGLGIVPPANTTIPDLGQLGLLYLMFLAGAELDFDVVRRHRMAVLVFSLFTFAVPLLFGVGSGLLLGYGIAASLLLGSLWASHTLLTYPTVREAGLASNPAVASAVGATVVTDTLSLVVLAAVAGYATGGASGLDLGAQLAVGLLLLAAWSFVVLPVAAKVFFRRFGHAASLRYAFILSALLSAAVVAEVGGIEGIVGAFFAGLGLNRLLPNEGPLFGRLEFYGAAFLIPVFLVSVGLIIDPSVMIDPKTIGLAAVFSLAVLGGKAVAAVLCRPLFRYSWPEIGLIFSLSSAQAAATLAATFVGFRVGLIGTLVVNAVLIVILVSVVVSSLTAARVVRRVPPPAAEGRRFGKTVLFLARGEGPFTPGLAFAARLAAPDGGVVLPVLAAVDGQPLPSRAALEAAARDLGLDCEPVTRADRSLVDLVRHAATAEHASAAVLALPPGQAVTDPSLDELLAESPVPVFVVAGDEVVGALSEPAASPALDEDLHEHLRRAGFAGAARGSALASLLRFPGRRAPRTATLVRYAPGQQAGEAPEPLVVVGGR